MNYVWQHGRCKAFHVGSNSLCHQHIWEHYKLYKECCAESGLKESHHVIPRDIARAKLEEKKQKKDGQWKLDGIAWKASQLVEFLWEGVLKAVAEFIICNNQVGVVIILIICMIRCFNILQSLLVANKATFWNCLIAMHPKLTTADPPWLTIYQHIFTMPLSSS